MATTYSINQTNIEELMDKLNRSGESWSDDLYTGATIRIGFPQSIADLPESVQDAYSEPSAEGLDPFEAFDLARRNAATQAMQVWAEIADLDIDVVASGGAADIYFIGREFESGAGYSTGVDATTGSIVRINIANEAWTTMAPGGKGFFTLLHEAGHSLGLSHPGAYDIGDNATYGNNAEFIEDTTMYSIMSYFGGANTGYDPGSQDAQILTPRAYDMWVVQSLYGANWTTRADDTTYGYNIAGVTAGGSYDFAAWDPDFGPVLTIWDAGGIDWLDLSGDLNDLLLDLNPGAFSSTHGMTYNLSIALTPPEDGPVGSNTLIEHARGGIGNDTIRGNDADNELIGGFGDDLLTGSFGVDTFDGGGGSDTVDFSYSTVDWTVDLGNGVSGTASNNSGTETLLNIENITTGDGDDEIIGSLLANRLDAGDGDDIIEGGNGADTLYGRSGHDELRGGAGDDVIYGYQGYWNNPSEPDNDTIYGGNGDDVIDAASGDDRVYGGSGNDSIDAGRGDDVVSGGYGIDEMHGGLGTDEVDYTYSTAAWLIDLLTESAFETGSPTETITGFENVRMGSGADTIFGDHGDNIVRAGSGADSVSGAGGADILFGESGGDTLDGGGGNDVLNGGSGTDVASYGSALAGVVVDLLLNGVAQQTQGAGVDTLISIERVTGSDFGDILYGNAGANWVFGGNGNDSLFGREGDDWLRGGFGEDILEGGLGTNIVMGDDGRDAVSYFFATAGVVVSLAIVGEQTTFGAGTDVLYGIEDIIGSFHADWLAGDDGVNRITAGAGDDLVAGGGGADDLRGGEGNDAAYGNAGADIINGEGGNDTLYGGDDNDSLTGSGGNDSLYGDGGRDSMAGGGNHDQLFGNDGNDALAGDAGNDSLDGGANNDVLRGGDGLDDLAGGDGDDRLQGDDGNDTLDGGTGNDVIIGGEGRDQLTGGTGNDTFDFNAVSESSWAAGPDTITGFDGIGIVVGDRIDLATIDAIIGGGNDAFTFVGTAAFSGAGQLRVADGSGGDTLILGNTDASTLTFEFYIRVEDSAVPPSAWSAADFIL